MWSRRNRSCSNVYGATPTAPDVSSSTTSAPSSRPSTAVGTQSKRGRKHLGTEQPGRRHPILEVRPIWNTQGLRHSVQLDRSHLSTLGKTPSEGLRELVWNAIDADATNIEIVFDRNDAGGIRGYSVRDDGVGITPSEARTHFLKLGGSWKPIKSRSAGGRPLHGSLGQGRYRAFSNGGRVIWESVAKENDRHVRTTIRIDSNDIDGCDISDSVDCEGPSRTEVRIENMVPPVKGLGTESELTDLTVRFALEIIGYSLKIKYDGDLINPEDLYNRRENLDLKDYDGKRAELTVIEWSRVAGRKLFLCDASGIALHAMGSPVRPPNFRYSAYVKWDGFKDHAKNLEAVEILPGEPAVLLEDVEKLLSTYFKDRSDQRRRGTRQPVHGAIADRRFGSVARHAHRPLRQSSAWCAEAAGTRGG